MKGIVFTEFIEMVEEKFGYAMIDDIIENSDLPSGGIYTAVGTYDHTEIVQLVSGLHQRTQIPIHDLLKTFGKHLFKVFVVGYPHFFVHASNSFDLLEKIDRYIHVEVLKLYPDAQLPTFQTKRLSEDALEMIYYSDRKMSDLADGLIEATIEHYKESMQVFKEYLDESGSTVRFVINKA